MIYRTFGRTELLVSQVGLGGGGASRLGLKTGRSESEVVALIHRALELGMNYLDTADNYGTESVIGRALVGRRDDVVLSTKVYPRLEDGTLLAKDALQPALDASLRQLRTDRVEVYHLHGVKLDDYDYCCAELLPELDRLRQQGKFRFLGISERNSIDSSHEMLQLALDAGVFDVMMVGFNLFNQSARATLFPQTIDAGIGIEVMASARSQFSRPELFAAELVRLVDSGAVELEGFDPADPLAVLRVDGRQLSIAEASYRFAAAEPGVHTVLVGTGSIEHLEENVAAFERGPLPEPLRELFVSAFGHLSNAVFVPGRALRP